MVAHDPFDISIVIPVYNNESTLDILITGIKTAMDNHELSYEIILVNDGSSDGSWNIIQKITERYSSEIPIKALDLIQNYGQENAKMAGLRESSGCYVVFMDADCQHDPKDIKSLYETCHTGFDICYANFKNSPFRILKNSGSRFYNFLATILLKKPRSIYLSSYNMLNRKIADKIKNYSTPILNIDALVLQHAEKVTQIFVLQSKSLNPKSNYTFIKLLDLLFKLLPGSSIMPIRLILILGILSASFSLLLVLAKLIFHLNGNSFLYIPDTFNLVLLTVFSLLLLSIGIIGGYVSKIYVILTTSQQYVVRTKISTEKHDKK